MAKFIRAYEPISDERLFAFRDWLALQPNVKVLDLVGEYEIVRTEIDGEICCAYENNKGRTSWCPKLFKLVKQFNAETITDAQTHQR